MSDFSRIHVIPSFLVKKIFKLSLKFLVLSLTDVEREGEREREEEREEEKEREREGQRERGGVREGAILIFALV